jgi:hypothetical protein
LSTQSLKDGLDLVLLADAAHALGFLWLESTTVTTTQCLAWTTALHCGFAAALCCPLPCSSCPCKQKEPSCGGTFHLRSPLLSSSLFQNHAVRRSLAVSVAANKMDTYGEVRREMDVKSGMLQGWNKFCFTGEDQSNLMLSSCSDQCALRPA